MSAEINDRVATFVREVCTSMGMSVETSVEESADNVWIKIVGSGGDRKIPRLDPVAWQRLELAWPDAEKLFDQIAVEIERASAFFDLA